MSRSLGGPMNAPHEEAVEFAKVSQRENRVYVGNLAYDVRYRDLMEFMRGGGWSGHFGSISWMAEGWMRSTLYTLGGAAGSGRWTDGSEGGGGLLSISVFGFSCGRWTDRLLMVNGGWQLGRSYSPKF